MERAGAWHCRQQSDRAVFASRRPPAAVHRRSAPCSLARAYRTQRDDTFGCHIEPYRHLSPRCVERCLYLEGGCRAAPTRSKKLGQPKRRRQLKPLTLVASASLETAGASEIELPPWSRRCPVPRTSPSTQIAASWLQVADPTTRGTIALLLRSRNRHSSHRSARLRGAYGMNKFVEPRPISDPDAHLRAPVPHDTGAEGPFIANRF
jgi:hypothetical protein